ncbi:FecR domain-containing protein [Mucilaginibacter sp. KACC 22773]|uniref:FecR family protein n=1 Tax=Mucilaginibacter sp. KACC 22773 TaxID=3025671 RepID=UPI0023658C50|nr:FecR family protein [Mucilaginibacter sp. KACC 22773]WDF75700.1 FecR domain-containing protein [Mucilaginibacter sp. KACC 22773]
MIKWLKPGHKPIGGEAHLHDEATMQAIEKQMLNAIHKEIYGKWYFIKTTSGKYAVAASFVLLCCSIALGLKLSLKNKINFVTVAAANGHINIVDLPDGSKVWLNSGSTIRYPDKFDKTREIQLINGEAFFDIKHDEHSPFIVHYGSLHARVLGTAFNIKYFKKLSDVRVTVTRGLVEVGKNRESFGVLARDNEVSYDQLSNQHIIRKVDSRKIAAWTTNEVNLYDVSFAELMLRLENIYNVHIAYDHAKLNTLPTTIHFSNNDNLQQVLEIIKTIHRVNYTVKGKEVSLEKIPNK